MNSLYIYIVVQVSVCVCWLLACLTSPPLSASLTRLWDFSAALGGEGGGEVDSLSLYIFVYVSVYVFLFVCKAV